ncbi:MAG: hypothetical protein ACTSVI_01725 [Promethearchaeota archaeon]
MPLGLFLIKWDPIEGARVHAKGAVSGINLSQEQVQQIFMSHASGGKPGSKMALQIDDLSILSKFIEKKVKDKLYRLQLIIILKKDENAANFNDVLDSLEKEILSNIEKPQLKLNIIIQERFKGLKERVVKQLDADVIRKRVIKKAQKLLDENKISQAQALLSYSKTVPEQLVQSAQDGAKLRSEKKYERSVRSFEDAKKFAKMLDEPELADEFAANAKRSAEIPILEKNREKAIDAARDFLRREEFLKSAEKFKEAADLSERLGDIIGKEINNKKWEILSKYSEIESIE